MTETEVKVALLKEATRIIVSRPQNDPVADLKEVYRMLIALYNEKL